MTTLTQTIDSQRKTLKQRLEWPMTILARACSPAWCDRAKLDGVLGAGMSTMPLCRRLYASDTSGVQVSAAFMPDGMSNARRGKNLALRLYVSSGMQQDGLMLSDVYISETSHLPCISAVQVVRGEDGIQGFVVADFDLRDLVLPERQVKADDSWRQIRGDPAIRAALFRQSRVQSQMDIHADDVISIFDELISERGVFHAKLHYSSSRSTLWLVDDPYRYRIHVLDEIINPAVCLAYPRRPYTELATVPARLVRPTLERFRVLREADETVYLRSSSINVINGMISLTFSCDGSHYMPVEEFLEKGEEFWFGTAGGDVA
ncbi:MAG: PDC sensor domain-containing protein [Sulfuricellaceae bacterium]